MEWAKGVVNAVTDGGDAVALPVWREAIGYPVGCGPARAADLVADGTWIQCAGCGMGWDTADDWENAVDVCGHLGLVPYKVVRQYPFYTSGEFYWFRHHIEVYNSTYLDDAPFVALPVETCRDSGKMVGDIGEWMVSLAVFSARAGSTECQARAERKRAAERGQNAADSIEAAVAAGTAFGTGIRPGGGLL